MTHAEIRDRIAALEAGLAELKANVAPPPPRPRPALVIERIHAIFPDDQAFREAARLGRQWRRGGQPKASKRKSKAS